MAFVDFEPTIMPYNTRRKSLSLPSLGIHVPTSQASRVARPSPPSVSPATEQPPSKKAKRSHGEMWAMSPPPKPTTILENTPPPSPAPEGEDADEVSKPREIDFATIKDEIVEAVITQLQKTGNRPHLVKELAAILSQSVKIVEQSANPSAIISSRLATYLKRPWTAQAPCPVAKELETVHPRRTYFYLTTCPHQPMSGPSHFPQRSIISPSLSSAASRSDEAEAERRRELSPSPEIDLSVPEFDSGIMEPSSPAGSFSGRSDLPRTQRAASPPLEKDEKEFTQTARGMQKRQMSDEDATMTGMPSEMGDTAKAMESDSLFGEGRSLAVLNTSAFASSPAMRPSLAISTNKRAFDDENTDMWSGIDTTMTWDLRSPEAVALDELDAIFDGF